MKNLYTFLVLLMLVVFAANAQVSVTFQVDMNEIALTDGVSPNGVHVAGDFQGWDPSATMLTDDNGDGIYTYTTALNPGTEIQYKYVNDNDWGADESGDIIGSCATSLGGNRGYVVSSDSTGSAVIPLVCFNSCETCTNTGVTFSVDMNDEITTGEFTPEEGMVTVAGSFQGWEATATPLSDADGDGIYETTLDLEAGDIQYKFIKNGDGWESVSGDCVTDGNRTASIVSNTTLPTICFNTCGDCELTEAPMKYEVTFQADMNNMIALYGMLDTVYVAGSFQGWGPGAIEQAMTDPDGDGVYSVTDSLFDGAYQFKYLYGSDWGFDETALSNQPCGEANGGNREVVVAGGDVVLEPFCFNSCDVNCAELGAPINVRIELDLSAEIPSSDGVFIKGSFQWPQFQDALDAMTPEGFGFYSWEGTMVPQEYFFLFVNGATNDAVENAAFNDLGCGATDPLGSQRRILDLEGYTEDVVATFVWNSCELSYTVTGVEEASFAQGVRFFPNPFDGAVTLEIANLAGENYDLEITSITGQVVKSIRNITQNRIEIPSTGMASGVYFATLTNTKGEQFTQKLIVE